MAYLFQQLRLGFIGQMFIDAFLLPRLVCIILIIKLIREEMLSRRPRKARTGEELWERILVHGKQQVIQEVGAEKYNKIFFEKDGVILGFRHGRIPSRRNLNTHTFSGPGAVKSSLLA